MTSLIRYYARRRPRQLNGGSVGVIHRYFSSLLGYGPRGHALPPPGPSPPALHIVCSKFGGSLNLPIQGDNVRSLGLGAVLEAGTASLWDIEINKSIIEPPPASPSVPSPIYQRPSSLQIHPSRDPPIAGSKLHGSFAQQNQGQNLLSLQLEPDLEAGTASPWDIEFERSVAHHPMAMTPLINNQITYSTHAESQIGSPNQTQAEPEILRIAEDNSERGSKDDIN